MTSIFALFLLATTLAQPAQKQFNAPNRSHSEEVVKGSARAIIVEFK